MIDSPPISVFVVDDLPEMRELLTYGMSEDPGLEVIGEAGDGRSGIEGVAATRPAAVLLDLSMPDMDGLQAIPQIRELDPDLAIVVFSGFAVERMGEHALSRGADAYVEKGTPIQEIREAIGEAVGRRREYARRYR